MHALDTFEQQVHHLMVSYSVEDRTSVKDAFDSRENIQLIFEKPPKALWHCWRQPSRLMSGDFIVVDCHF